MAEPAIVVDGLRVRRGGEEVLRDIGCTVRRGTVTGLLGPNGCGKSTLMRSIVGVQLVESGRVDVLGRPAGHPELRRRIGYATQDPAIYADLTVTEALRYFAAVLGTTPSDVDRVITQTGLTKSARVLVGRLSGGQRGRANLAVALLGTPELLVLDEPTVGSDPELRDELWQLFHGLAAAGVTLLISSHVMDEAARCDDLLLLHRGRVLARGTPEDLRARTGAPDLEQAFLRLIRDRTEAAR
ncbi:MULTISPECIES: ABC transporter ATP-binding protein [unclassified Amycolatopsis]|uniref:ABC transporter ATP-binding protein n=1 Tax=unclassified Amycolatopsis TaxID=2618356 RepID=UPI002873FF28|nr:MULTISPECIES: ABC transporter ATP-binding protein [unclassified Amycolatopsis]MDS0135335.1 ABC transporter ATP-binding protein [Amycolatopsis sp. 505]MDS0140974.1 ABC transporter ATP-binding protein [Amycolatopsis sp. CM201R]